MFIAILFLLLSMLSVTTGASLAKGLFPIFGALGVTSLRLGVAAILLVIWFRPWRHRLTRTQWIWILSYGLCMTAMNAFFYLSISRIPLGVAIAIEFLGPLSLALFASRKKLDFLWVLLAGTGIVLLLPFSSISSALDPYGVVFALVAAALWAGYILIGKKAGSLAPSGVVTSIGISAGALAMLPFASEVPAKIEESPVLLLSILGVGFLSSAIPYTLEMTALRTLPTKSFGILLSLEPAIGALSGYLILSEVLDPLQILAVTLVILASIGTAISAVKPVPPPAAASPP